MKKLLCSCLTALIFMSASVAQKNLSLLGNLKFPGNTLAGVWHYVDGNTEYALVGTSVGMSIVDVTNPASPQLLFNIPGAPSLWREVKTYGHFAYVSTEGGGGITIVDMDSLPLAVNYKTYTGDGAIAGVLSRAHTVQVEGNYLYINGSQDLPPGGVVICDLADPWNPVYIANENLHYVHDCFVRNDTLWTSEIWDGQFSAFDITNKSNPVWLASQPTPASFNHNGALSDNGQYFFTTDELSFAPVGVFDVSDLSNIKQVDLYYTNLNPTAEVHNVRVLNDFLINPSYGNTSYGSQLTICDAARPFNIIETANFPLGAPTSGLSISWDASPYLPSGNIIVTDVDSGLFILAPTYVRACYLEGVVTDSITGALLNNVLVEILATPVIDSTILTGEYKTGLADAGVYDVRFTKSGYNTKTITGVTLVNGVLTQLDIQLWDGVVGISTPQAGSEQIFVSPNPFTDKTTLTIPATLLNGQGFTVAITDVTGRVIKETGIMEGNSYTITRTAMDAGIYFYKVISNNQVVGEGKLVIQ